eukprot:670920-Alexandrium_andersonii.AAC.1
MGAPFINQLPDAFEQGTLLTPGVTSQRQHGHKSPAALCRLLPVPEHHQVLDERQWSLDVASGPPVDCGITLVPVNKLTALREQLGNCRVILAAPPH